MHVDAKTCTQRSCKQTTAGGGTNQCKGIKVNLYAAGRWSLVNHDVDAVILHCRVEILLDYGRKAVDFIDEKDIFRLQRGKDTRQVTRLVQYGARCYLEAHAKFIGNDVAKGCLTQSGRAVQQGVVKRLAALTGSLHKDTQVLDNLALSGKIIESKRTQSVIQLLVARQLLLSYIKLFHNESALTRVCSPVSIFLSVTLPSASSLLPTIAT